jgi:hypothetical protein
MFARHTFWLALIALFAMVGPFCGALAAVTCAGDCCCGHSNLSSSCAEGACLMSQPATAHQSAVKSPETRTVSMADLQNAAEPMAEGVTTRQAVLFTLLEPSPPDILLSTQHFLI